MKLKYVILTFSLLIIISSCDDDDFSYSTPKVDIEYSKNDSTSIEIDPVDICIREKAWIEAEYNYNKDKVLNAVSVDKIRSEDHSDFTNWSISGDANKSYNLISGGYGWGYGYGYGSAYTYPSLEIIFLKEEVPDIDKVLLGFSEEEIFMTISYNAKRDILIKTMEEYYILWINLNNIPMKFIDDLNYIKILDD